jgi:hypothetical protein
MPIIKLITQYAAAPVTLGFLCDIKTDANGDIWVTGMRYDISFNQYEFTSHRYSGAWHNTDITYHSLSTFSEIQRFSAGSDNYRMCSGSELYYENPTDTTWTYAGLSGGLFGAQVNGIYVFNGTSAYQCKGMNNGFHLAYNTWNGTSWTVHTTSWFAPYTANVLDLIARGTGDIWVVGSTSTGKAWARQIEGSDSNPLFDSITGRFYRIWNISSTLYMTGNNGLNTGLIYKYNGTTWSAVATTGLSNYADFGQGADGLSSTDIWASAIDHTSGRATLWHFNGTSWSSFLPTDNPAGTQEIIGIKMIATNDVWACGSYNNRQTMWVLHWNGSNWSTVNI